MWQWQHRFARTRGVGLLRGKPGTRVTHRPRRNEPRLAAGVEHWRALGRLQVATVVDTGANKGQFALVTTEVFPGAAIYCSEPLEQPTARLRSKMLSTGVRLFEMAIGRSQNHRIINVSRRADSSTLLLIAKQSEIFPGTELWEKRVVLVAPLTKFLSLGNLEPLALLKIDVQGYKLEGLKGCDSLLFPFRHVYSDCSFVELYQGQALDGNVVLYLLRRNFERCGVYNQVEGIQTGDRYRQISYSRDPARCSTSCRLCVAPSGT